MSNTLLDNAIDQFAKLPGIGRKTALRLVLHMLRQEETDVTAFADALTILKREVKYCKKCHNISDSELCPICADKTRDGSVICVVENIQDVLAIERTMQYKGLYHVLGGIISNGVSGKDGEQQIKEVIFALASTMEGDTTNFYISRKLREFPDVKLSVIARGINVGDELQYTDEVTLGRSILNRTPL